MALDTFTNLKSAIINFLDRSDLDPYVDDFIALAEARHKREIVIRDMIARSQATIGGRFLSLPTRFVMMKNMRLLTTPPRRLQQLNLDQLTRERDIATGKPSFFAIHEEIEFDVVPDQAYTVEIIYYASFPPLSSTNASNALLVRAPDAYLYGALAESAPFLTMDERVQTWETRFGIARDGLLIADRKGRATTPLASRIEGPTP